MQHAHACIQSKRSDDVDGQFNIGGSDFVGSLIHKSSMAPRAACSDWAD
jgi:hypothetical protein